MSGGHAGRQTCCSEEPQQAWAERNLLRFSQGKMQTLGSSLGRSNCVVVQAGDQVSAQHRCKQGAGSRGGGLHGRAVAKAGCARGGVTGSTAGMSGDRVVASPPSSCGAVSHTLGPVLSPHREKGCSQRGLSPVEDHWEGEGPTTPRKGGRVGTA